MAIRAKRTSVLILFISTMLAMPSISNANQTLSEAALIVAKKAVAKVDATAYNVVKPVYDAVVQHGSEAIRNFSQAHPAVQVGAVGFSVLTASTAGVMVADAVLDYKHWRANKALVTAIDTNDVEKVEKALKSGADLEHRFIKPNHCNIWLCSNCAQNGNVWNSWRATTPIHFACEKKNKKIVKLLLENGAYIDGSNNFDSYYGYKTPLIIAIENGDYEIAKLLINKGARINTYLYYNEVYNPLYKAISENHYKIAKLLLDSGAQTTDRILQKIIANDNIKAMEFLIKNGTNINEQLNNWDISYEMLKLLINNGADLNIKNAYGLTPLQIAVSENNMNKIKLLLPYIDDIDNHFSDSGLNPLHIAVEKGYAEIVSYLLDNGADVNTKTTTYGETAFDLATSLNNSMMIKILKGAGAASNKNLNYYDNVNGISFLIQPA